MDTGPDYPVDGPDYPVDGLIIQSMVPIISGWSDYPEDDHVGS